LPDPPTDGEDAAAGGAAAGAVRSSDAMGKRGTAGAAMIKSGERRRGEK